MKIFLAHAPEQKDTWFRIRHFIDDHILPSTLHWKHPNFYAYFPGGNGFPNMIGDMLSTVIGGNGFSWVNNISCFINFLIIFFSY